MNNKVFDKTIVSKNTTLRFIFSGTEKKTNIYYKKIIESIDNCFNNLKEYQDVCQIISWIRTLLKEFNEESLELIIASDDYNLNLKYLDKKLVFYELEQKNYHSKCNDLIIKYEEKEELSIKLTNPSNSIIDYPNYETLNKLYLNKIKELNKLQNINIINLTQEDKIICKIYKLFYNEWPDFNSKDINLKIQTMMCILAEFDICISDNISFSFLSSKTSTSLRKIPISIYLCEKIKKLKPLGKIKIIDNSVVLKNEYINRIKIIGELINDFIPEEYDEVEILPKISSIIYIRNNLLPTISDDYKEIEELSHSAQTEVESTLTLKKKIEDKIKRG